MYSSDNRRVTGSVIRVKQPAVSNTKNKTSPPFGGRSCLPNSTPIGFPTYTNRATASAYRTGHLMLTLFLTAALAPAQPPADWKAAEAAHLANVRQVTFDYVRAGEGYFSPDGKQIIF